MYVYKFRSMSKDSQEYTGRAITHQELYFANARSFNDPFDCLPVLSMKATKKEFEEYLDGFFDRQNPEITRQQKKVSIKAISNDPTRNHKSKSAFETLKKGLEQAMNIAGVLSLSKEPDHVLMWSHYADCHQGICLKFKVCSNMGFFTEVHDVEYQKERPVFNMITGNHEDIGRAALLTKADFWEYEKEVRIVSPKRRPGVHKYPAQLLEGVILGANISEDNIKLVKSWIATLIHEVELYKAVMNPNTFSLDIKKYNK